MDDRFGHFDGPVWAFKLDKEFVIRQPDKGMSMREIRRDVIAAFAMNALILRPIAEGESQPSMDSVAMASYRMADIMIEEADRQDDPEGGS